MLAHRKRDRMENRKKPASTWHFKEGVLTVDHDGKKVVLGRYATRELAAKAAADYFAKHGGQRV
jgi:hypothetical protein